MNATTGSKLPELTFCKHAQRPTSPGNVHYTYRSRDQMRDAIAEELKEVAGIAARTWRLQTAGGTIHRA